MSNPLLRPGDPRFVPPPLRDAAGNNLFVDPDAPIAAEPADGAPVQRPSAAPPPDQNLFAAPPAVAPTDAPAYEPQYETTHPHRGILLLVLAIAGLAGDAALLTIFFAGPLALVGLAAAIPAAVAWLGGQADLKAMRQGAIDKRGLGMTRLAMWLGIAGCVAYVLILAVLITVGVLLVLAFVQDT